MKWFLRCSKLGTFTVIKWIVAQPFQWIQPRFSVSVSQRCASTHLCSTDHFIIRMNRYKLNSFFMYGLCSIVKMDVYKNSRLRLEYAKLLFNKFMIKRINSELIKIGRIWTLFLMTESSCSDRIMLSLKLNLKKVSIEIFVYLELVFF